MKASPEAQLRLLELAELDAELSRLDHRRHSLPELDEYQRIEVRDAELRDELTALEAAESDLGREQAKAEADVDQVRSRVERDQTRLDIREVQRIELRPEHVAFEPQGVEYKRLLFRSVGVLLNVAEGEGDVGRYERLRTQHGVGAAALRAGRCEGCHLSLNTVDLARIRAAAPDEVLRCEECRRILVRTPESGL